MLSTLKHFLGSEKAPYIVTLFVAAVAWTSVRTAERLSSTSFIEYRLDNVQSGSGRTVEVRLRNITQNSVFPCFQLMIASPDAKQLTFGASETWDQLLRGTVLVLGSPKRAVADEAVVEIQNLYPGGDFAVRIPAKGTADPRLLVRGCTPSLAPPSTSGDHDKAKSSSGSNPVPILVPWSARTFFVEWEMAILWLALVLWGLLMLAANLSRPSKPTPAVVDLLEVKGDIHGSID